MIPSVETRTFRIAVLSGAGGGVPDLRAFCATSSAMGDFAPLTYPGWQRYAEEGFARARYLKISLTTLRGWADGWPYLASRSVVTLATALRYDYNNLM